jgi:hypothetical protein
MILATLADASSSSFSVVRSRRRSLKQTAEAAEWEKNLLRATSNSKRLKRDAALPALVICNTHRSLTC